MPRAKSPDARARQVAEACTCFHLRQAARSVTQAFDAALRPLDLRATQFTLLNALSLTGPVGVQELAERLVMDRTTLTRNLGPLERRGLVVSRPGGDRRVREVELTPAGRRLLAGAYGLWQEAQDRMEEALGAKRLERLLSDLGKAVAASR